jgi:hypothetical protein
MIVEVPSPAEFQAGWQAFQLHEKRDAMYSVATFLIAHFWGRPHESADGLGVLLLTWNQAFYRYGLFDFDRLEDCIRVNQESLAQFRMRNIVSYSGVDDPAIRTLFNQFLIALQICEGSSIGKRSPVSASKALHLLAPRFFPLWDGKIARAYNCYYDEFPDDKYVMFTKKMQVMAAKLAPSVRTPETGKTLLKLIDEYNYAKYTKGWI